MSPDDLQQLFDRAVEEVGDDYCAVRKAVRERKDDVETALREKTQEEDWRIARTAEMLLGWRTRQDLFEQCAADVRAEWAKKEKAKPISGQVDADRRAMVIANHGEEVVPRLLEMITKSYEAEEDVEQDTVLLALGYLRDRRATEPLLYLLERSADDDLRRMVVRALGMLEDPRANEPMIQLLQAKPEPAALRGEAIGALVRLRTRQAAGPLQELLVDRKADMELRQRSAQALGRLGDASATPALVQAIQTEHYRDLHYFSILSLEKIGDRSALPAVNTVLHLYPDSTMQSAGRKAKAAIESRPGAGN